MKDKEKAFRTASEVVRILATICRIMLIISAVVCVVTAILFIVMQSKINFNEAFAALQEGLIEEGIELPKNEILNGFLGMNRISQVGVITIILLLGAAAILAVSVVFDLVAKLFKNFQLQKTPFIQENVQLLRKIAYWMFGILAAGCVLSIVISLISNYQMSYAVNFDSLALAFVALGLTYVFEYGCKLEEKKSKKH